MSGCAPNWVHAGDAAHAMLAMLGCRDAGIVSFGNVHDSFSVNANDVSALIQITKEKWIEMYGAENQLERMKTQMLSVVETFDGETPELGNLDVQDVLESDYFFC